MTKFFDDFRWQYMFVIFYPKSHVGVILYSFPISKVFRINIYVFRSTHECRIPNFSLSDDFLTNLRTNLKPGRVYAIWPVATKACLFVLYINFIFII